MKSKLTYYIFILLALPIIIFAISQIQKMQSKAAPKAANIVINTKNEGEELNNSWTAISQGGEEPPPMLSSAVSKIRELSPKYIRIDHIFDYYNIVQKKGDKYSYDYTELDETVKDIIQTGALPFFSLSYMPSSFTASGSVIDTPTDWNNWKDLIKATIEHYSGKNANNLSHVYYEVWNEPELPQFGSWKLNSEKDYRILYYYASKGAQEANNTNIFYFGGPAVGSYYPNWIDGFLKYVAQNKLRLDFYSWHRYSRNPEIFAKDAENTRLRIGSYPEYSNIQLILSEWGIDSERNPINNTNIAAAFSVSAISSFNNLIKFAFNFEAVDGPPPNGGNWGLITNKKDDNPLSPKPKFFAFSALKFLKGNTLSLKGEGTFVHAIASKNNENINLIISNYDEKSTNSENVPITFTNLEPSSYTLQYNYILEKVTGKYDIVTSNGTINKTFLMTPNSILLITLSSSAPLAKYTLGRSGVPIDKALLLSRNTPLVLTSPEFILTSQSSIDFDIQSLWNNNDKNTLIILEAPFINQMSSINRLYLLKRKVDDNIYLVFGITDGKDEKSVSSKINDWQKKQWHHVNIGWDNNTIYLKVDNNDQIISNFITDINNGKNLTFYPIEAALDNLEINISNQQRVIKSFDSAELR